VRLELAGIQFSYGSGDILRDVGFKVEDGEILSLVGPNGSGKTTILKCINRILKPKRGKVLLEGKNIDTMKLRDLARTFGYIPQSSPVSFPLTVFDMVLLGRKPYIRWKTGKRDYEAVFKIIELMGLDEMAFRAFDELSGGEKQRALVARAFAQEPRVLLFDEPISNLDLRYQLEILDIVSGMVRGAGLSAVMAMHDLNLASRFSDKIVMLKKGEIFAAGRCQDVINADNIREVYGIEVAVYVDSGKPQVVPVACVREGKNIEKVCS